MVTEDSGSASSYPEINFYKHLTKLVQPGKHKRQLPSTEYPCVSLLTQRHQNFCVYTRILHCFPPPTLAKPLHLSRCNYKLVNKTRSTVRVKRDLIAEPPLQCYKNWKPIDATKFGYDVSVRPPVRPYSPHDSGFIACSKISALENGFKKLWVRMPDSLDTCGRKPNPERKSCGFKNIRIRVDTA